MYADQRESKIIGATLISQDIENWIEKTDQTKNLLVAYRDLRLQCITTLQSLNDQITVWWEECEKHPNLMQELNKQSVEIQKLKDAVTLDKILFSRHDHKAKTILKEHIGLMAKWRPDMENREPCFFNGNFREDSEERKDEIGAICTILPEKYEDNLACYKDHIAQLHNIKNKIKLETLKERKKLCELFTAAISRASAVDSRFSNLSQQLVSAHKNIYTKKMEWLEEKGRLLHEVSRLYSVRQSQAVEKAENTKLKNSQIRDQKQNAKYTCELEAMLDGYKKKCEALERTSQTTRREADRQQCVLQEEIQKLKSVTKQLKNRLKELDVRRQEQVKCFRHNMNTLYKRLKSVEQSIHKNFPARPKEQVLLDEEILTAAEVMLKNGQLLQMELEDLIQDVLRMQSSVIKAKT